MFEGIDFILIGAAALISFVALFLVVNVFFPGTITRCRTAIEENNKRTFWIGFINTLVMAILAAIFANLGERAAEWLFFPAIILLVFYIPSALFGLIALGQIIGERLFPDASPLRQKSFGSGVMILACLFPFLGWYVLFPFLLILGFGSFLLAVFRKKEPASPEPTED